MIVAESSWAMTWGGVSVGVAEAVAVERAYLQVKGGEALLHGEG